MPYSLKASKETINSEEYIKITIFHPNSFVEVNDKITIKNADSIGDILSTPINTTHDIYSVNYTEGTYCILLKNIVTININDLEGDGGGNTRIKTRSKSRFLFNYSDTIGNILGFKNVGNKNAITNFNHKTTNFDDYIYPNIFNEIGKVDNINNMLNLTGLNTYLLMFINDFESIISNSISDNAFSKIVLNGVPGDYLFNTFVNSPLEFQFPINNINELNIKFKYADGTFPDFRNYDHSFTLRLTELIYKPKMSNLDSKESNYLNTLIDKTFVDGLN